MSWQDEMVPLVRALVDDSQETSCFAEERLERLIVAAARLVQGELGIGTEFVISASAGDISPDPTAPASLNDAFVHLVVLKAACMAERGAAAAAAASAVAFSDAGSSFDGRTAANIRVALLGGGSACQAFLDASDRYRRGLALGIGICSPPGGWLLPRRHGYWGRS